MGMREYLKSAIDSRLTMKGAFGSIDSVELQCLMALDILYFNERPNDDRKNVVFQSYIHFLGDEFPGHKSDLLAPILCYNGNLNFENFVIVFKKFVKHVYYSIGI